MLLRFSGLARTLGLIVFVATPALYAQARDPREVQPERPTVATHAGTVAPGWFEIEAGVEHDRFGSSTTLLAPTVLKLGLASHVQLGVFTAAVQPSESSTGLGDAGVMLKWRILDDAPILGDFAIQPGIKFPTGSVSGGMGTGTTDALFLLISSHQFGPVAMDLNAGYSRRSGNGTVAPKDATLWTASFGGQAIGKLGWVFEVFGYPRTTGPAGASSTVAVLAGPTFLMHKWAAFDIGVISPLAGPQPRAAYVGTVINLGRVW